MSEIKFRAWSRNNRKMYYIPNDGPSVTIGTNWWTFHKNDPQSGEHLANELTGVLMRFTGLKDKNGKEIYEGDIVETTLFVEMKLDKEPMRGVIKYADKWATFYLVVGARKKGGPGVAMTSVHEWYYAEEGEIVATVVGNIYENPELAPEK